MRYEEVDGKTYLIPVEASDVSEDMLALAEEIYDGWFDDDDRIDWEDFIDRMCSYARQAEPAWELDEYDNGAVNKIKRHVREYRNA